MWHASVFFQRDFAAPSRRQRSRFSLSICDVKSLIMSINLMTAHMGVVFGFFLFFFLFSFYMYAI